MSVLVARDCNSAIGGQGQSGCTVCGLSATDPRVNYGLAFTLSSMTLVHFHIDGPGKTPPLVCTGINEALYRSMTTVFGLYKWCGREFESLDGLTAGVLTIVLTCPTRLSWG